MDIEQMAIDAGVIEVTEDSTYWTENNAIEVLEKFAQLVLEEYTTRIVEMLKDKFKGD